MLRISRSCLVNLNYVREVNRTLRGDFILVLAGGATVTSSEGFRGKVKEYLSTLRITVLRAALLTAAPPGEGCDQLQQEALHARGLRIRVPDLRSAPGSPLATRCGRLIERELVAAVAR